MPRPRFHLAFPVPVHDLAEARRFYGKILGCSEGSVARLRTLNVRLVIEPGMRFAGEIGEQATLFLIDPSGNALEFKSFRDDSQVFARD